jgi:hypothetical protein
VLDAEEVLYQSGERRRKGDLQTDDGRAWTGIRRSGLSKEARQ